MYHWSSTLVVSLQSQSERFMWYMADITVVYETQHPLILTVADHTYLVHSWTAEVCVCVV